MSDNALLEQKMFQALDDTFDKFESEHGMLNDNSDFDLYGKYLDEAVHYFNKINGTNFIASEIIQKHSDQPSHLDGLTSYMEEATEKFRNL